jgi:hypothetical protein
MLLHAHGRTKSCYAHAPNLNVDQVPPNRALFVQPQLPYGKALMRYIGGLLLRVFTKVGRLRAAVAFGRANGGSLDSQLCFGPVPVWDKFVPRDGWSHAVVVSG